MIYSLVGSKEYMEASEETVNCDFPHRRDSLRDNMEPLRNDSPSSVLPSTFGEISRHSCVQCRLRKVRCDRMQPCSTCFRNKTQCIFQEVRRRRHRVTRTLSTDIVARIERLEERIEQMSGIRPSSGKSSMSASDSLMGKQARPDSLNSHNSLRTRTSEKALSYFVSTYRPL